MRFRTRRRLDALAHVLYCPTMVGQGCAVTRWHHRIHLIPGWLFRSVCDRFEASVWEGEPAEPLAPGWQCSHMVVTSSVPLAAPSCGQGCQMERYYAPTAG